MRPLLPALHGSSRVPAAKTSCRVNCPGGVQHDPPRQKSSHLPEGQTESRGLCDGLKGRQPCWGGGAGAEPRDRLILEPTLPSDARSLSRNAPPDAGRLSHSAAAPQGPLGQDTCNRQCSRDHGPGPGGPAGRRSSSTRGGPGGGQQRLGTTRRPAPPPAAGALQKESPLRPRPGPAAPCPSLERDKYDLGGCSDSGW